MYHVVEVDDNCTRLVQATQLYLGVEYVDVEMDQAIIAGFDKDMIRASFFLCKESGEVVITGGSERDIKRATGFARVSGQFSRASRKRRR
jgi:hypothetical protein